MLWVDVRIVDREVGNGMGLYDRVKFLSNFMGFLIVMVVLICNVLFL